MKTYNIYDAMCSRDKEIAEAYNKGHYRKAEQLKRHKQWLRNGCVGHEPSLKRWKPKQ